MALREYQKRPTAIAIDYFNKKNVAPKIMVLPTAWGKSHLIAHTIDNLEGNVLILQPSKELLEQNYGKYTALGNEASIYSASLNQKEIGAVTYATIGSIKNLGKEFKARGFKYVLVDECDSFRQQDGMFPDFIKTLEPTHVLGVTATPLKTRIAYTRQRVKGTKMSMLTYGKRSERFYSDIIHVSQVSELVEGGYWCPLVYEIEEVDTSLLKFNTTGADYDGMSVKQFYYKSGIRHKILKKLEEATDRKSILVFVPSVEEAEYLTSQTPSGAVVSSKTPLKEREQIVTDFKAGKIRTLFNVDTLTIGFDHPEIDCIICGRSTPNVMWWMQALGRGVRISPEKKDTLIVDFSGNYSKFGPIEKMYYGKQRYWELFNWRGTKLSNVIMSEVYDRVHSEQKTRAPKNNRMPFGKHKGLKIKDLPIEYIRWLVEADVWFVNSWIGEEVQEIYNKNAFY